MSSQRTEDSNQLLQCFVICIHFLLFFIRLLIKCVRSALVVSAFQSYLKQNVEYPLAVSAVQVLPRIPFEVHQTSTFEFRHIANSLDVDLRGAAL